MGYIRVDQAIPVFDGQPVTFKSPASCTGIEGLKIYYPAAEGTEVATFALADAHGNNVGSIDLFAANVLVKVILDTEARMAYVQNADTNAYLEGRFEELKNELDNLTLDDIGAAPAGYGLGSNAKLLTAEDDLNNIWENGWYHWNSSAPQNAPTISGSNGGYGYMRVDNGSNIYGTQTVWSKYTGGAGLKVERQRRTDIIDGWSWVNPPMSLGVEYRTTERFKGKPVYVKAVNIAAFPAAAGTINRINVNARVDNVEDLVSAVVKVGGDYPSTLPVYGNGLALQIAGYPNVTNGVVYHIETDGDYSHLTGVLTVRFTKTTD